MNTVADALALARSNGIDRLDAQLLVCHVLRETRSWVLAHDDSPLTSSQAERIAHCLERRAHGEPLAYITGEKEFHGLVLHVTPAVLIPRPDTETLVDWAIELMQSMSAPEVLDLGTGSGAIALALKHRMPSAHLAALDVSHEALAVARGNAHRLGLAVTFQQSDWWQAVAGQRFDLLVSNPPYIAEGDPHLPGLRHEPQLALTAGIAGLSALATIAAGAVAHLKPGGWLLFEHGRDQAEAVTELLRHAGFSSLVTRHDLAGNARCTGGRLG